MTSRKLLIFVSLVGFLALLSQPVLALKVRTRQASSGTATRAVGTKVASSVRFRPGRNGIIINFSGLNNAKSVNYKLTYSTNGTPQGAMGTITNLTKNIDSRELLFGTCSGGVCRYHGGITNARLVITSKLKSGITTRKSYRLKV